MITAGTLTAYQYAIYYGFNETTTRTMVFSTLIASNIFLTLVNRSFHHSIFTTMKYKNDLIYLMITITIIITASLIFVRPLAAFFQFQSLNFQQLLFCILTGFLSVSWYEVVKWIKRRNFFKPQNNKAFA
jgi:Ca2+-transporting ATPase